MNWKNYFSYQNKGDGVWGKYFQNPFVSLPNNTPDMEEIKTADGQFSNRHEKNNPPHNRDVPSPDGPSSYQSSVGQQNGNTNFDAESVKGFNFNDKSIRRNFSRIWGKYFQNPFVSLLNITPDVDKTKTADGQFSNRHEENNHPHNGAVASLPSYQSSVIQQNEGTNFDAESVKGFHFNDKSIRRGFIRKVCSLISLQLLITSVLVFLICHPMCMRDFMFRNGWIFLLGIIGSIISWLTIGCSDTIRRNYPTNMIGLVILTVCEGICLGYTAASYQPDVVFIILGLTIASAIGLSLFTIQAKYGITKLTGALVSALSTFTVAAFIAAFTRDNITGLIFTSFGVILFSVYLIHEIQLMIDGEHEYDLSPEEYIQATLILYTDILRVCIYILDADDD